jgi:hypothetical protein
MLQEYWWSVGPSGPFPAVRNAMHGQDVAVFRLDRVALCRVSILDCQLRLWMILHFRRYRNTESDWPEVKKCNTTEGQKLK